MDKPTHTSHAVYSSTIIYEVYYTYRFVVGTTNNIINSGHMYLVPT